MRSPSAATASRASAACVNGTTCLLWISEPFDGVPSMRKRERPVAPSTHRAIDRSGAIRRLPGDGGIRRAAKQVIGDLHAFFPLRHARLQQDLVHATVPFREEADAVGGEHLREVVEGRVPRQIRVRVLPDPVRGLTSPIAGEKTGSLRFSGSPV